MALVKVRGNGAVFRPSSNGHRIGRSHSREKSTTVGSRERQRGVGIPQDAIATVQHLGCTLAMYADAKQLPIAFLRGLGLTDFKYFGTPAVRIPYTNPGRGDGPVRFRTALTGGDRFRWRNGSKIVLYGLDRLDAARRAGHVALVEGESDCHTLWLHNEPAVGVAGAGNWKDERDAPHLADIATIYVVREPGDAGEGLIQTLAKSVLRDRTRIIRLHPVKDPSALHLEDPTTFRERWERAKAEAVPLAQECAREAERQRSEFAITAGSLVREQDILGRFATEVERAGVSGEERTAKITYLSVTSRLLPKPVSVVVKGPSSAGKSHTTGETLAFFPPSAYYALSSMSERALAYSQEPLKHRTLVLYEAAGLAGEFATYLLRSLLSEGCIRYETVEKTADGICPRLIEREGPTNVVLTTTSVRLHPENETRLFSVPVADTQIQTAAVMRRMAEGKQACIDYAPWHALQEWLARGDNRVIIPFAWALANNIPPIDVRLRRDFRSLLSLIAAHALLHQGTRVRDEEGRIVATLADYEVVRTLVADLLADGVGAGVSAAVRETVSAVAGVVRESDDEVSVTRLAKLLRLDKSAASRRIKAALDKGYLINRENRRGRPARLALGEPMPEDRDLLPAVEVLQCCIDAVGDMPPHSSLV